jgi:diguanylate cyclase (GGDEF)-like protein/PAS domain S-box-containing protein
LELGKQSLRSFALRGSLLKLENWRRIRHIAPVLALGIVGIAVTVTVWGLTDASENRTLVQEFSGRANNQAAALQNGVNGYLDKLYAVRALFDSSGQPITREEFEGFSNSLLAGHAAILNIGWIPRIKNEDRAAHELAAAHDGLLDYHIRAIAPDGTLPISPKRDEYFPKFYSTEPRISRVYGLDNKDGGAREQALAHIRDADVLSSSPPLVLHIGRGDRRGFWAGLPVYARGLPHETVEERRNNLLGVIQGVFQIGVMTDTIAAGIKSPTRLYLFAPKAALNDPPIYFTSRLANESIGPRSQAELAVGLHRSFPLNFGDVPWTLVVTPETANLVSTGHTLSSILLISGLLLSTGLTAFFRMTRRYAHYVEMAKNTLEITNDKLGQQKILLDAALENMSQGLCMFDADGRILLFNARYANMMGLSAASLKGISLLDLIKYRKAAGEFAGNPDEFFARVVAAAREGKSNTRVIETSAKRALRVIEQPKQDGGWVSTMEDITEWREAQAKISHMAHHDALTGVANRTQLVEELKNALAVLPLRGAGIAVHFIDLDHFKSVNDTLGHDGGDFLLKTVAERLRAVTRIDDIVARLGGDEFIVVQTGVSGKDQAEDFAHRLISAVTAPMKFKEQAILATVSVGVALAPADGTNPERLLKSADLAMYKAKAEGRNCVRFFLAEMDTELQTRFKLEKLIRDAVLHNRFELHYQPLFEISERRLIGFEALIRLPAEDGTLIPPLVFIPIAEDLRLLDEIGGWVLQEACRTAATWPEYLTVAVNLSPTQFLAGSISDVVAAALKDAGLAAHRLELEITETLLLGNSEATMAELKKLKAMGVAIVMDDFGTGYSSLSYLWRFPFDKIKIDRSFMKAFDGSGRDAKTVVKTIIALGRELNMRVTVEGVETATQADFLDKADGDQAQGFYFGRPVPASEISANILADFQKARLAPPSATEREPRLVKSSAEP